MRASRHIGMVMLVGATVFAVLASPAYAQETSESPENSIQENMKFADTSSTDIRLFNETISDKNKVKSLFFTQQEVTNIHLAINTYLKHSGRGGDFNFDEEEFIKRLGGLNRTSTTSGAAVQQSTRFYTYPQFFLDSIVYHTPKDWTIWLNEAKISNDTPQEGKEIIVREIAKDHVTLVWQPVMMEKVLETWRQVPNDEIEVDTANGLVIFTLRPNQTFSSYVMRVLEGRILPVTVDTATTKSDGVGGILPELLPQPAQGAVPLPMPEGENGNEGISGLINRYNEMKDQP